MRKNIRKLVLSNHIKKLLPFILFSCVYYNTFYNAEINYKKAFAHGDTVHLQSQYKLVNKIKLKCKTLFLKGEDNIAAEAFIDLVVVSKKNDSIKIVRKLPQQLKNIFSLLEEGIKND